MTTFAPPTARSQRVLVPILLLLILVGGLITYKIGSSLQALWQLDPGGALQARAGAVVLSNGLSLAGVLTASISYFAIVGQALLFGILISGAVRLAISPEWIADALRRRPVRAQLAAGVAGAPLMLCSCCMAPVFSAVYERSSRLGPALALMFAAPSLNPAALALTFMLFDTRIATGRLVMALIAVFLAAPLLARLVEPSRTERHEDDVTVVPVGPMAGSGIRDPGSDRSLAWDFLRSSVHVAARTVPFIFIGVFVSVWLAGQLPMSAVASAGGQVAVVAFVALLAVPIALPTFFEVPLALTLLTAGAPAGAAAAVLFAGPAINLPSLLTIGRSTGWKVAAGLALAMALLAFAGGLVVG